MRIPEHKWIILIIILSAVLPVSYFLNMNNPGFVLAGRHIDDGMNMAVMKSYLWNYMDPFMTNSSIFNNPIPGPPYLFAALGIASAVLMLEPLVFLFLMTFIFSAAYLIIIFNIMKYFSGSKFEHEIGFLFFTVATGIGGIIYAILLSLGFGGSLIHLVIGAPIFSARTIYIIISLATGYAAFMLLAEGKTRKDFLLMTLLFGATTLFYPFFGAVFLALGGIFCIVNRKTPIRLLPSLVFFIPWIASYLQNSVYGQYATVANTEYYNFFAFLANGGFTLIFTTLAALYFIKARKKDRKYTFLMIWSALFLLLAFLPNPFIPRTRFMHLIWVPLSMLAAKGASRFSTSAHKRKILAVIVIALSAPSIVIGFAVLYKHDTLYLTSDEFDAMKALRSQPPGNVLSSFEIGSFIPVYSEKMSLRGERQEAVNITRDYTLFYSSNSSQPERTAVLEKYNISYVFFSNYERNVSSGAFDPGTLDLEKIYANSEASVYRIKP